jgi:hypothetical protein
MPRLALPLTILLLLAAIPSTMRTGVTAASPAPTRAAFYYPTFPRAWTHRGIFPYSVYHPTLGYYDSGSTALIRHHVAAMLYANVHLGIAVWNGPGSPADRRLPVLLPIADGDPFHWALDDEREAHDNPSIARIRTDLLYIAQRYAGRRGYQRIGGRFVVFVNTGTHDSCATAARWQRANAGIGAYLSLRAFNGYRRCARRANSWYANAPAHRTAATGDSYTISPGYWTKGHRPRLVRNLTAWSQAIRGMVASRAHWQLITTFNDWPDGTAVESAAEWSSPTGFGSYLDALHRNGVDPPTSAPTSTPAPPPTATATPPPTPPATIPPTSRPTPTRAPDETIVAAGDIACDPADPNFAGGAPSACQMRATANLVFAQHPNAVLPLGDDQYEQGALAAFERSYDPTWGRLKAISHPAVGNHEYDSGSAAGYFTYFGVAAGPPDQGYYSYDLGAWHLIVLNSNCGEIGGCAAGSPQEQWLRRDLADHPTACTLAYWHHPLFSSGLHGDNSDVQPLWHDLYDAGADIVLNGHDHDYERFAPQDPSGRLDPTHGIREFVVGTGGKSHYGFTPIKPNSEVRNAATFGILRLILHPDSYDWQFIPAQSPGNGTFTDTGSASCH